MENAYAQTSELKVDVVLTEAELLQKKRVRWVKIINICAFMIAATILLN